MQIIDLLNDCGLYDAEKYPWHAQMIDRQCSKLSLLCLSGLHKRNVGDIIIGLSRIPISPVKHIINQLLENFSQDEFSMFLGALFIETKMFESILTSNPIYIRETDPSARMICHYLNKTTGNISKEAVTTEIFKISQLRVAQLRDCSHILNYYTEIYKDGRYGQPFCRLFLVTQTNFLTMMETLKKYQTILQLRYYRALNRQHYGPNLNLWPRHKGL